MRISIDPPLKKRYEGLSVHEAMIQNLRIEEWKEDLESLKRKVESGVRKEYDLESLREVDTIRKYRDFFWKLGIDPTKTRPASEALIRRILQGKELPRINTAVDAYNLVSVQTHISIASFDEAHLEGRLKLRLAKEGEEFLGIGMKEARVLKGNEIVISDERDLIAIYPYRDGERTKVTQRTTDVYLLSCGVPGIDLSQLKEASLMTQEYLERFCK